MTTHCEVCKQLPCRENGYKCFCHAPKNELELPTEEKSQFQFDATEQEFNKVIDELDSDSV